MLYAIVDLILTNPPWPAPLAYPLEEVWLFTLAHALHARIDGKPYVFSELHRVDRVFWHVLDYVDPVIGRQTAVSNLIRRSIKFAMIRTHFHRIDKRWVDVVAQDDVSRVSP